MAKKSISLPQKLAAATSFIGEVRIELSKVVWPTRADIIKLTSIVVASSILIAIYIGLLDLGFTKLVDNILLR